MENSAYDAFDDPYAYPGTTILQNLLHIQEPQRLERFEVEMSFLRAEEPLPEGRFDASHYCKIHHHLFQDVYAWAGQYRTVRTSKGGNPFCYPEYIHEHMDVLFKRLENGSVLLNVSSVDFIRILAKFLGELNAIHPFREGNGRAQLAFLDLLGKAFSHPFSFSKLRRDKFLSAMIASYRGNIEPLVEELTYLLNDR
jgi:cell filamentation protein